MRFLLLACSLFGVVACQKPVAPASARRAEIHRTGGTTFEIVPTEGQHPHCLVYTISRSGLTRQLTMSKSNQSFLCPAGRPIGGHAYKVPLNEGPVRVYLFFTSAPVNAASVSQQIVDSADRQAISAMNMRLPGQATLEVLDFVPEEDVAAEVGSLLQPNDATDGGQP